MSTVIVEPLGSEFIVRVLFNDGYTRPMQLKGYYKTFKAADKRRTDFIKISEQPMVKIFS